MRIEVTQAYTTAYPDPIQFEAGEALQVEREDDQLRGWFWCIANSGRKGWVHRSFLASGVGLSSGIKAYSAKELTVQGGERGTLLSSLDGWVFVQLDAGETGWLPVGHVGEVA